MQHDFACLLYARGCSFWEGSQGVPVEVHYAFWELKPVTEVRKAVCGIKCLQTAACDTLCRHGWTDEAIVP